MGDMEDRICIPYRRCEGEGGEGVGTLGWDGITVDFSFLLFSGVYVAGWGLESADECGLNTVCSVYDIA